MEPTIRITVDGRLALTTAQAATRYGLDVTSVRTTARRAGVDPVAHLDARTPLYPAVAMDHAMRARLGKGANLRRTADGDQGN